ncbi:MAG: DUF2089 domain-containing protein [Anaerolineales bacterium]|nr:DUF2089 domain-containing protein [Anaerolineales bacterium]
MFPIFNECPVCHGELIATQLECRHCETKLQGRFQTGHFSSLSLEQLDFVELFIRHEGKITRLQAEMGLSYPTIRNRLHEIIRALGYEPGEEEPGIEEEKRRQILEQLEQGNINSQEAINLIKENEGV